MNVDPIVTSVPDTESTAVTVKLAIPVVTHVSLPQPAVKSGNTPTAATPAVSRKRVLIRSERTQIALDTAHRAIV